MKTKPQKTCPPEFKVEIGQRVWAKQNVPGVDVDFETASMMDHDFKAAHTDWNRVWRNWMRTCYRNLTKYKPYAPNVADARSTAEANALAQLHKGRAALGIAEFRECKPGESVSDYRLAMDDYRVKKFERPRSFGVVR